jgi:hypothetical protein
MKGPTREINEYFDLNEWQVAGIQKAVASLDRGEGFRMIGSKSGSAPGTARGSNRRPRRSAT